MGYPVPSGNPHNQGLINSAPMFMLLIKPAILLAFSSPDSNKSKKLGKINININRAKMKLSNLFILSSFAIFAAANPLMESLTERAGCGAPCSTSSDCSGCESGQAICLRGVVCSLPLNV
ncbi:hypothetical protein F5884DRAFT_214738 [Xylogone sp. PMI_703]|nr:hypothetical protein F5884DRAFT_214738 [Xylogone sp. PMI_703]